MVVYATNLNPEPLVPYKALKLAEEMNDTNFFVFKKKRKREWDLVDWGKLHIFAFTLKFKIYDIVEHFSFRRIVGSSYRYAYCINLLFAQSIQNSSKWAGGSKSRPQLPGLW
jgi:hypothetical protein